MQPVSSLPVYFGNFDQILLIFQGIIVLASSNNPGIPRLTTVPDIARTEEAQKLSAMIPYDFSDGKSNGDSFRPVWKRQDTELPSELDLEKQFANGHI